MILPITLTIAAAAVLLHIWLMARTSQLRRALRISIGDGGDPRMLARMRAHANFGESMPLFLIMLGLIEHAIGSELWLWGAAIVFILARILHAFGMEQASPQRLRMIGMTLTALVLVGLAGFAIFLAYSAEPQRRAIEAPLHSAGTSRR